GGLGRWSGGDGVIREFEALAPMEASILAERRRHAPGGAAGGRDGARGCTLLNGVPLASKVSVSLAPGDVVRVETPGCGRRGGACAGGGGRAGGGGGMSAERGGPPPGGAAGGGGGGGGCRLWNGGRLVSKGGVGLGPGEVWRVEPGGGGGGGGGGGEPERGDK